jgi:hypothetical protein
MKKRKMKFNKKKHQIVLPPSTDIASEMILNVAAGLIAMGDNLEEKQNYLNTACTAWNLSLLPENKRDEAIDNCIEEFRKYNINVNDEECEDLKENYRIIIDHKIRAYPNSKKHMLGANAEFVNGEYKVNVMSFDPDKQ